MTQNRIPSEKFGLILASASERRVKLLIKEGIKFEQIAGKIQESTGCVRPSAIVRRLAFKKAKSIAELYPDRPVLGADTLVFCRGKIIGKPKCQKDAIKMLALQNGAWQSVYTGVSLVWLTKNLFLTDYDVSECKARKLPERKIKEIASKHPDKAGGYAVQDSDDIFIERIKGRYDTVVGLPVNIVKKFLKKAKIPIKRSARL